MVAKICAVHLKSNMLMTTCPPGGSNAGIVRVAWNWLDKHLINLLLRGIDGLTGWIMLATRPKLMSKDAWILYRNTNSQVPWEDIVASGYDAVPCDCDKEGCYGWKLERVKVQVSARFSRRSLDRPPDRPSPPPRAA